MKGSSRLMFIFVLPKRLSFLFEETFRSFLLLLVLIKSFVFRICFRLVLDMLMGLSLIYRKVFGPSLLFLILIKSLIFFICLSLLATFTTAFISRQWLAFLILVKSFIFTICLYLFITWAVALLLGTLLILLVLLKLFLWFLWLLHIVLSEGDPSFILLSWLLILPLNLWRCRIVWIEFDFSSLMNVLTTGIVHCLRLVDNLYLRWGMMNRHCLLMLLELFWIWGLMCWIEDIMSCILRGNKSNWLVEMRNWTWCLLEGMIERLRINSWFTWELFIS